jgi:hypothetical protein
MNSSYYWFFTLEIKTLYINERSYVTLSTALKDSCVLCILLRTCNAFRAISSISSNSAAAAVNKYSISIPENISKKDFSLTN